MKHGEQTKAGWERLHLILSPKVSDVSGFLSIVLRVYGLKVHFCFGTDKTKRTVCCGGECYLFKCLQCNGVRACIKQILQKVKLKDNKSITSLSV